MRISSTLLVVFGPAFPRLQALRLLRAAASRLAVVYPATNRGWGVTVMPLHESLLGTTRTPLLILVAGALTVLLIACANVAGLLLARGIERAKEFAIRTALGASRSRLLRQQIVESLLLSAIAGGLGFVLAGWALPAIRASQLAALPLVERLAVNARIGVAAMAASIVAAVAAAALPAIRASRLGPADLQGGARVAGGHLTIRHTLVFVQVAAATALLAGGGLLVHSFARLMTVAPGFDPDAHALLATVSLPSPRYSAENRVQFFDRALREIRMLPSVRYAGAGGPLPLSGSDGLWRFGLRIEGRPDDPSGGSRAYLRWATPGYFAALGVPLREGRTFLDHDSADAPKVAVVDDELVRRVFPGENPIGRRVRTTNERDWREIVGVVGSVRQTALDRDADPHLYVPEAQMPSPSSTFIVRADTEPRQLSDAVRRIIGGLDPAIAVTSIRTLQDLIAGSVAGRRFSTFALALFALTALALTLVGVYGIVAQIVAQSTREMGVRMALGAGAGALLASLTLRALKMAVAGIVAGLGIMWTVSPLLTGMLFGVSPHDPLATMTAGAVLVVTVTAASIAPAGRVLRLDVVRALRVD